MKFLRFIPVFFAAVLLNVACNPYEIEIPNHNNQQNNNNNTNKPGDSDQGGGEEDDTYPVKFPKAGAKKTKTLLTSGFFTETKIKEGITLYQASRKKDDITNAYQNVNVLEVDLNNEAYKINFVRTDRDSTTSAGRRFRAIAAINAAYEQDASYIRVNGNNWSEVTIKPDDSDQAKARRWWKHEAAIVGNGKRKVGIVHGASGQKDITNGGIQALKIYKSLTEKHVFSSAPMLIDNYDQVGTKFVPSPYSEMTDSELKKNFNGEDYRCHQGVRHPRTAVALTEDNDILFITVDGRFPGKAEGMDASELTKFIAKHFNPQWAINMDGGGSTSMYLNGYGFPVNDIVNYPCDDGDGVWDQVGQRMLNTFFLVEYDE